MSLPGNQAKLEAAEKLAGLADEAGLSLIHLALAFVTTHPAVTSAIIGPRTAEHLESQLGAADTVLTPDILDQIDEIVPPGTNLNAPDRGYDPPALADPSHRQLPQLRPRRGCRLPCLPAVLPGERHVGVTVPSTIGRSPALCWCAIVNACLRTPTFTACGAVAQSTCAGTHFPVPARRAVPALPGCMALGAEGRPGGRDPRGTPRSRSSRLRRSL